MNKCEVLQDGFTNLFDQVSVKKNKPTIIKKVNTVIKKIREWCLFDNVERKSIVDMYLKSDRLESAKELVTYDPDRLRNTMAYLIPFNEHCRFIF